jgi:raffinose synthase
VLRKLVLPDGTVLRAQLPGRPTRDALFSDVLRDGTSLLKVSCKGGLACGVGCRGRGLGGLAACVA